mmetsp:Transcript_1075/g.2342  ORF Transcript_1075/g.2342 Transcript_1075/m.2342 type:complete len:143 (-) Transcript_1075:82-510(-)
MKFILPLVAIVSSVVGDYVRSSSLENKVNDMLSDSRLISNGIPNTLADFEEKTGHKYKHKYHNSVCRTDLNEKGTVGVDYYTLNNKTFEECRAECTGNEMATGFEWRRINKKRHERNCEIWTYPSQKFKKQKKHKHKCQWKN